MPDAEDRTLGEPITTLAAILNEAIAARLETTLKRAGLSLGAFELLSAVKGSPNATQAELANNLGITPSSLCEAVRTATAKGIVEQQSADHDRRIRRVVLTRKGSKVLEACLDALGQADAAATTGIPAARLQAATEVLRQAIRNLGP